MATRASFGPRYEYRPGAPKRIWYCYGYVALFQPDRIIALPGTDGWRLPGGLVCSPNGPIGLDEPATTVQEQRVMARYVMEQTGLILERLSEPKHMAFWEREQWIEAVALYHAVARGEPKQGQCFTAPHRPRFRSDCVDPVADIERIFSPTPP